MDEDESYKRQYLHFFRFKPQPGKEDHNLRILFLTKNNHVTNLDRVFENMGLTTKEAKGYNPQVCRQTRKFNSLYAYDNYYYNQGNESYAPPLEKVVALRGRNFRILIYCDHDNGKDQKLETIDGLCFCYENGSKEEISHLEKSLNNARKRLAATSPDASGMVICRLGLNKDECPTNLCAEYPMVEKLSNKYHEKKEILDLISPGHNYKNLKPPKSIPVVDASLSSTALLRAILEQFLFRLECNEKLGQMLSAIGQIKREKGDEEKEQEKKKQEEKCTLF